MMASSQTPASAASVPRRIFVVGGDLEYMVRFRARLLRDIVGLGHHVIAATPDAPTATACALTDYGMEYVQVPMARTGTNPITDLRDLRSLTAIIRSHAPDVYFGYGAKPASMGVFSASDAGVKHIAVMLAGLGYAFIHGSTPSPRRWLVRSIQATLYRRAFQLCDRVILQNPDDVEDLVRGRILDPARAVRVHGSGVDLTHYGASEAPTWPPRFLFVGRLLRSKGVHELVDAARIVRASIPEAEFHLAGATDINPDMADEGLLRAAAERGDIILHGQVADVRPLLRLASAFVLPSYYREGVPRSGLEALASGRTVIVADVPGSREIVSAGVYGALVRPRDAEHLAATLLEYARDPDRIRREGLAARARAESTYAVESVNQSMLEALGLLAR